MIISDLNQQFFKRLEGRGKDVKVLVHSDVDALCACRIIIDLFDASHIGYVIIPVSTVFDIRIALNRHCFVEKENYVLMLNCGGNINLIGDFDINDVPAIEDIKFFIIDSHQPYDLDNIYDDKQVFILVRDQDKINFPDREMIYRDESDSDDENSEDGGRKRKRLDEQVVEKAVKRKTKQQWIQSRDTAIFDYYTFSHYDQAISCLLFELSYCLSKATASTCFWAVIGLTSQFIEDKISIQEYTQEINEPSLHMAIKRLNSAELKGGGSEMKHLNLTFNPKLLNLNLLTEWSLMQALEHTQTTVCRFSLWTLKGKNEFDKYLADLGLPRNECGERYDCLKTELKKEVIPALDRNMDKYELRVKSGDESSFSTEQSRWSLCSLLYPGFTARFNYSFTISAKDAAMAIAAMLHFHPPSSSSSDVFSNAFKNMKEIRSYELALHKYSNFLKFSRVLVDNVVNNRQIEPRGSFLLLNLQPMPNDLQYMLNMHSITVIGSYILQAFLTRRDNYRRHSGKPLILCVLTAEDGMLIVTGIPPLIVLEEQERPKSFLGRAFERAANLAKISKAEVIYCNANVIQIQERDRLRFFDCLLSIMET